MDYKKQLIKFEKTIKAYIHALDNYTEEQFLQKPEETHWSIGQVYSHLILFTNGTFKMHFLPIFSGEVKRSRFSKNFSGRVVFLLGSFPPGKFRMPSKVSIEPRQPESKEFARMKLIEIRNKMREINTYIKSSKPDVKTRHPGLGYLNALEWYQFIDIHFCHHLRQIKRIEKTLNIK